MHYFMMQASPVWQQKSLGVAALHAHCPAPQDRARRSLPIPWVEKFRAGRCSQGRKAHQHEVSETFEETRFRCCIVYLIIQ